MKNYKNYISLIILLTIMCGIMIAITQISKTNTLNTTDKTTSQTNTEPKPTFSYIPARQSSINHVEYENNFGGSGVDEVFEIFKLEDFIIIGKTNSTDKYFTTNSKPSLYVLIVDTLGNAKSTSLFEVGSSFQILSSKIYRNKIYILINHLGTKLLTFDISNKTFDIAFFDNNPNAELVISNEPIVLIKNNNSTNAHFCITDKTFTINYQINSVSLACEYSNGTLLIFNSNNQIIIGILTLNYFDVINQIDNSQIETINITEENIVMIANQDNSTRIILLDLDFNIVKNTYIAETKSIVILSQSNQHILIGKQNNNLVVHNFCSHGTLLSNKTITNNVKEFKILSNSNEFQVAIQTTNNQLIILTTNILGEIKNQIELNINTHLTLNTFVDENNSYILLGQINNINQLITNCFGESDIYICKINKV